MPARTKDGGVAAEIARDIGAREMRRKGERFDAHG
jgi:hypothetical protein